jgi:hypothetical protein
MSKVLYLPTPTQDRIQVLIEKSEAREIGDCCSETERIAHELKNCMSVLLLAITGLKDNLDQSLIPVSRRQVLADVVAEMNRLVDEIVVLSNRR